MTSQHRYRATIVGIMSNADHLDPVVIQSILQGRATQIALCIDPAVVRSDHIFPCRTSLPPAGAFCV